MPAHRNKLAHDRADPPVYRALDLLTGECVPKVAGREPFWRPAAPDVRAWEPAWSWTRDVRPEDGDRAVVLDCNGAYLGAAATVEVAHGALTRSRLRRFDPRVPALWWTPWHDWPLGDRIMSPLGTRRAPEDGMIWLTTPTMQLLDQLAAAGKWPALVVEDAWTADRSCRLRRWAGRVTADRLEALQSGDEEQQEAVKEGYSVAVTLLGKTDAKAKAYRPDWAWFVRSQHAATVWRKAWRLVDGSWPHGLLSAGAVDELVIPRTVMLQLWRRQQTDGPKGCPIVVDVTGATLGTFKVKRTVAIRRQPGPARTRPARGTRGAS